MSTGYLIAWTGGYDVPSYVYKAERDEAFALAAEWLGDMDAERDTIDVLAIDTDAQTVTRLDSGTCKHCVKRVLIDPSGTVIDMDTGGDVCGMDGGNEPHEVAAS